MEKLDPQIKPIPALITCFSILSRICSHPVVPITTGVFPFTYTLQLLSTAAGEEKSITASAFSRRPKVTSLCPPDATGSTNPVRECPREMRIFSISFPMLPYPISNTFMKEYFKIKPKLSTPKKKSAPRRERIVSLLMLM